MKRIALIIVALAVLSATAEFTGLTDRFVSLFDNTTEYIKEIEIQEVEVSEKETRIEAAQNAKLKEVEMAAQAAYDNHYKNAMTEIRATVLKEMEGEFREERTAAEKEIGVYWRDVENVKRLIKDTFPEDPHTAISVARCESGLKANAVNKNNPDGSIDGGLWQINSMHDSALERMGLDKWNVEDATKFARHLYDSNGGWRDWMCYTRGMITMR